MCLMIFIFIKEAETETNDAKLPERNNDDTPTTSKTHRKELKTNVELIDTTNIENDLQDLCAKKGGFNAFAFICPLTRYEETNIKFLKGIVSMFGQSFFSRCILILTQRSKEQIDETELQKEINKVSDMDDNLRKILGDENRYLLCPNFEFEKLSERYDSFQHSFANSLSEIAYRCFIDSSLKIKLNIEDDIEHNSAPDRKCDIL